MDKITTTLRVFVGVISLIHSLPSLSMEALSESEMAAVNGQDGITVRLQNETGISADQINWTMDENATNGAGDSLQNSLRIGKPGIAGDGFSLTPIGPGGAPASHDLDITLDLDAYTNSEGRPGLGIDARWDRMRARIDSMSVSDDSRSFGTMALDSEGRFALFGDGGLFNANSDHASLLLNVGNVDASDPDPSNWVVDNPGQLYYRQGTPTDPESTEARLDNLGFLLNMRQGTLGIDSDGLLVSSAPGSRTDFNLTFDVVANANSSFQKDPASDLPMLFFGWRGGLENFDFRLKPGGTWLPDGTVTEGITTSLGFDLADDFQVVIGEAGDDRSFLEFTDPQSLPNTLSPGRKDVEFGALTLDAISPGQGVGGICFGGSNSLGPLSGCSAESFASLPAELIEIPPSDTGLALIARDWGLHTYSSKVSFRDDFDSSLDIENQGWALIYTLGDLASNVYLYPQLDGGIRMDAVAAIQTLGTSQQERWENGTHFMIGDTDMNVGIGLVGSDVLFATQDMGINLSLSDGGLRFHSEQGTRLQLRGMFGGGEIPDMSTPVNISYFDMNLEFDEFAFNVLPHLNGEYLNFGGFFSFANLNNDFSNDTGGAHGHDDGSYISLAEPGFDRLDVDFRLDNIRGDIGIPANVVGSGGKIDLISASSASDNVPKLRIESNMNIGTLATSPSGAPGDPLLFDVEFGGSHLGSMAIPSSKIYSSITLKPQQ